MNARDELAEIIWDKTDCQDEGAPDVAADAILAAGYRKPQIITTVTELDALDWGTVILDHIGDFMKFAHHGWYAIDNKDVSSVLLPATVLYTPKAA